MIDQKYRSLNDIPERKPINQTGKLPAFWEILEGEEFRSAVNMLILNEIRHSLPETDTDSSCRARLATLKGYINLLDLPAVAQSQQQPEVVEE